MISEHLIEDKNIKITEDTVLNGIPIDAGTKLNFISRQGQYSGLKMRVPPPEFEALLFFNALDSAAKAETLKKLIKISKSPFDGLPEVDSDDSNRSIFFSMCQHAMAAVAFSVSAVESWANNSIAMHGTENGNPIELTLKRPNRPDKNIMSNCVASDISIPIRPKLLQLVPQVFACPQLTEYSTLRKRVGEVVDERNMVMHMQNTINLSDEEVERVNYAVKLLRVNSLTAPETMINYVSYIYELSHIEEAQWVTVAKEEVLKLKKKLK